MKKKIHILILEDNSADALLMKRELRKAGLLFTTRRRVTKEDFLKALTEFTPDLILAAYSLTAFDGLWALSKLRENNLDLPFILVSETDGEEKAIEALNKGAVYHVLKRKLFQLGPVVKWALCDCKELTEHKKVEEAIIRAKKEWERTFDSVSELIILTNLDQHIRRLNLAMAGRLNIPVQKVVGRTCCECVHGTKSPPSYCPHTQMLSDGREHRAEFYSEKLGGHFRETVSPFHDTEGRLIGGVHILSDITREKEVDEMKSDFISVVAHEMRTPLNNITESIAQVLDGLYGDVVGGQKKVLDIAHRNCRRMEQIINDLLDITRIEAGKIKFRKSFLNVTAEIKRVICQFKQPAKTKKLSLKVTGGQNIPAVFADPDRLEQILVNLIGNALKFTPAGGEVSVKAEEVAGYITCSVSDTGIGITPENIGQLFTKFKQFDSLPGRSNTGSGLGLAITKQLVEMHGGEIWAVSQPGQGSRFTFKIPDYRSERVFRDCLRNRIKENKKKRSTFFIIGIKLDNLPYLKKRLEGKISLFFEQLSMALMTEIDQRINMWHFEDTGEFMAIMENKNQLDIQQSREKLPRLLEKYQFLINGNPIKFGLLSASAVYPDEATSATQLIKLLRDRLSREKPFITSAGKILIVDDIKSAVHFLNNILKQRNFNILKAYSGRQALTTVLKEKPDLILLDMVLPKMSGDEIIGRLKEKKETSDIPLIIITAYSLDEEIMKKTKASAIPSLSKPLDQALLFKSVYAALNLKVVEIG